MVEFLIVFGNFDFESWPFAYHSLFMLVSSLYCPSLVFLTDVPRLFFLVEK